MKKTLLFILSILFIVTTIFIGFGFLQTQFTKEKFLYNLENKASDVTESIEITARYALTKNDQNTLDRLVQKFQNRKNLQGCVIYDKNGKKLAITKDFSAWLDKTKPYIQEALLAKQAVSNLGKFEKDSVYVYVLPILNVDGQVLGLIEVIYDTTDMFNTVRTLWKRIGVALIALILILALCFFIMYRRYYVLPIRNLTKWFQHFQKGETDKLHDINPEDEIGELANEVEQVALSLRVARNAVVEHAQNRIDHDDTWTEDHLKDLVCAKLGESPLFVVSNREPFMHVMDQDTRKISVLRPASGVVTAVDPLLRAVGGVWVAHGAGNVDKKFVNSKDKLGVPPGEDRYILKRVWLTKEEEGGYYYGFANEGLWPLCHMTYTRPIFRNHDWIMYQRVNQKFAEALLEELPAKDPYIFIQDYHFTMLPKMIKDKRPDARIVLFWHIPWPNSEIFSVCPYQQEILEGILGCDLIGFHTQNHCNNFLETVNRFTECRVDMESFSVTKGSHETIIRSFPISIDVNSPAPVVDDIEKIRQDLELEDKIVAVGVDRIDYTKGIAERILAIDRFLEKYPDYKNKFVFIQLAAPSRTHIDSYHKLIGDLDELVRKVNWKHQDGSWKPIIYLKGHFPPEEVKPYYALADICIVSSLHDGLNLVSKEYVLAKTDLNGSLILSSFTGASKELTDALLINPYSIEEFADTIKKAVDMPEEERKERMANLRKVIIENNVYKWAGSIIAELASLKNNNGSG